jgi:cellulose synthase/poly-beta-1,6-N-acetylglucosamine synthase-like glycosyltransferase
VGLGRSSPAAAPGKPSERLLFLIPAHNEQDLIERCVQSLLAQDYPAAMRQVVIVADNCTDATASLAAAAGATVLERFDVSQAGKGFAIQWALERLPRESFDAMVVIDADTIVEPDFATELTRFAPLTQKALQAYDGLSNEYENNLTRLAGVLTRSRYEIAIPVKVRAGLSCPLTGDGIILGSTLLQKHPWRVDTITEGWELYARLTLAGEIVGYVANSRLYAQEAKSIRQSGSQRIRWSAGRMSVLREYWRAILRSPRLGFLQKLDLFAELSSQGPVTRAAISTLGIAASMAFPLPAAKLLALLFALSLLQTIGYSLAVLIGHPQRMRTVAALAYLPGYALWRLAIAVRALAWSPIAWVRTSRHVETGHDES